MEPQHDWVLCRVRDEGPGLSAEDQDKLFQTGIQLTPKPTAGELSTGYGLAMAKELIEKVGGRFGVKARLGRGPVSPFDFPNTGKRAHGSGMTQSGPQEGKERRG